jgi:hypothetical protein
VDLSGSCIITSDIFKEEFRLHKVEAPHNDEFQIGIRNCLPLAHFEEAVEDEDEFLDTGGNNSKTLHTLARFSHRVSA